MKLTMLQMVQKILSDLDSDQVTSIDDTIESLQVADIVEDVYFQTVATRDWPHFEIFTRFDIAAIDDTNTRDDSRPNYMRIPFGSNGLPRIEHVSTVYYNKRRATDTRDKMEEICYLTPMEFLHKVNQNISSASNVEQVTDKTLVDEAPTFIDGATYYIRNDTPPTYWTSFDDTYVAFDSYDSAVDEDGLVPTKSQLIGLREPVFDKYNNEYIPDLPSSAFPEFLAEAKSTAFTILKQSANAKVEQQSKRTRTWGAQHSRNINRAILTPNYGRRSKPNAGIYHRNPLFEK